MELEQMMAYSQARSAGVSRKMDRNRVTFLLSKITRLQTEMAEARYIYGRCEFALEWYMSSLGITKEFLNEQITDCAKTVDDLNNQIKECVKEIESEIIKQ